jgi:protein-S-isoprenylcysteine O-methyltransferase Ste14
MSTPETRKGTQPKRAGIPQWAGFIIAFVVWVVGIPLAHGVIPWAISLLTPRYGWMEGRPGIWNWLGLIPVIAGSACLIWIMVLHFAQTPELVLEATPQYLLKRGPYAFMRNPMYVAELALWIGWAFFYGSIAVLTGFLIFGLAMNFIAVPYEERRLEARFGEAYLQYKNSVPRWPGKRSLGKRGR